MGDLAGKTALITGSGTGIGLAIAKGMAGRGASVVILGRRREPLEAAARELEAIAAGAGDGGRVRMFPGVDVADAGAVTAMFGELERDGATVDILVNNAGVSGPVTCFANASEGDFESAVAIHLTGTFWTSAQALRVMRKGGIIVTITTFFAEERPLEQRPYRFRTPYTAAQGAKNRLAEALSVELVDSGIVSVATNPGPVHSDRIYKTVYPKAAAEFMRVGGFGEMSPRDVERACAILLPALGEGDEAASAAAQKAAGEVGGDAATMSSLLQKVSHVAEKIQKNTAGMIADGQFLSQDQVALTVMALCEPRLAATINGKVIPGDRVFYPVRPHVAGPAPRGPCGGLGGKAVVIVVGAADEGGCAAAAALGRRAEERGGKAVMVIDAGVPEGLRSGLEAFHSHVADTKKAEEIARWLAAASSMAGGIAGVAHVTGAVPAGTRLCSLDREGWDALVERFLCGPARTARAAMEAMVPGGGADPRLYRGAGGAVIIVGPPLPSGKRPPRDEVARAEVFRGALRPLAATANQELADVLGSKMRLLLALPGSAGGAEPDHSRVADVLDHALSGGAAASSEVIFCTDEARA
ncbi:MAG: SDR family NAD(P)-dependent oxidoreductase [Thaumarchaeota archaeon]|nr:SDR family NAD(P)-dependent oxidoreductase [Nitrososphaerota archaeon]